MKNAIKAIVVFWRKYIEFIFVFVSFPAMALVAYFSIGGILQDRLLDRVNEMIVSTEANVKIGLVDAEGTLFDTYDAVHEMLVRGAPKKEILDYLTASSDWIIRRKQSLLSYTGIFAYIYGEFYDSIGLKPNEDYIPQKRPWYQTAIRNNNSVAYTAPYPDPITGEPIFSVVKNIELYGETVGILVVNVGIYSIRDSGVPASPDTATTTDAANQKISSGASWLGSYVTSIIQSYDGYGILLDQNIEIMAHPRREFVGCQLQELGKDYVQIAQTLRSTGVVTAARLQDNEGNSIIVFFKRIFNGWYVGRIISSTQFFKDVNITGLILGTLAIFFSLLLCYFLLRLSAARQRSDEKNESKSSFLARMSHEIRTPMNAIYGMSELLLREDLPEKSHEYAHDIKQASMNLLSIINDILDFSKIEAGRMEITPVGYLFASLINDTINIIRMRLAEKPIQFFTNIDGNIPNALIGDEVRLRQILFNLLTNAVKYTERGYIGLTITIDKREGNKIWLRMAVTDTGFGISREAQEKLFHDFYRVDTTKTHNIEGTGLGLAIARLLCMAMGGDITITSEQGKGSTFSAIVCQEFEVGTPFALVDNPEQKKVLLYETREVYARSVRWTLDNLKVPYTCVTAQKDFTEALTREKWFYVFAGYGLYEAVKPVLSRPEIFPAGEKPSLALLTESWSETHNMDVRLVNLAMQALSVANILNGKAGDRDFHEDMRVENTIRYFFPSARLLVVDDMLTNLKVAEGLLAPSRATVELCQSGLEAIELVKSRDYDIVFMDHMMPGMDGIETVAAIRALEGDANSPDRFQNLTIVALTANAIVGMREMFLENGFDDFLAKPMELSKLDEILVRWIPREKRIQEMKFEKLEKNMPEEFPPMQGIDIKQGIERTSGTLDGYRKVLSIFCKESEKRLAYFRETPVTSASLRDLTIHVHAIKSAAASIGAQELSSEAARLEAAGQAGDAAAMQKDLPPFAERLTKLITEARAWELSLSGEGGSRDEEDESQRAAILPLLHELLAALKSKNASEVDRILEELSGKNSGSKTKEALEAAADQVLLADFEGAAKIVGELLNADSSREKSA